MVLKQPEGGIENTVAVLVYQFAECLFISLPEFYDGRR